MRAFHALKLTLYRSRLALARANGLAEVRARHPIVFPHSHHEKISKDAVL
jgi:hypothetical protein